MSEPTYLTAETIAGITDALMSLQQRPAVVVDSRIVPAYHVAYDVEPYYIANGYPVADSALGIDAACEIEIGEMAADEAYSSPLDPRVVAQLGAQSRWLPMDTAFDGLTWAAHSGDERIDLDANGSDPFVDSAFQYARGRRFVTGSAMRLDDGDHFLTDGARWTTDSVAAAMVVVLRAPMLQSYGLFETYDRDGLDPNRPFVGLRYTSSGRVEAHSRGLQGFIQSSADGLRANQPVIVAFTLTQPSRLDVVVVDRTVTTWGMNLGEPHPYDARLYVGRSPGQEMGTASMDILEIDYWLGMPAQQMLEKVHVLDRLYGVTQ